MMGRWGWLWGTGLLVGLVLPEPGVAGLELVRVVQGGEQTNSCLAKIRALLLLGLDGYENVVAD